MYGRRFQVVTDHRPLQWLMSIKEPTDRLARWALRLQEFDIDITYRPGKINQNADCLSRIPLPDATSQTSIEEPVPKILLMTRDFLTEQAKDKYCTSAREQYTHDRGWHSFDPEEDYVLGNRNQDEPRPRNLEKTIDPRNPDDSDDKSCLEFVELPNGLMGTPDGQILVPESLQLSVLKRFHDSPYAGHLGTQKTIARLKRRYLWPGMTKMIKDYVRNCVICAKRKAIGSSKAPLKPIPPPEHVWQMMAMDIVGPLTPSQEGHCYILVMGEYLTRYMITAPMPNQTADTVAKTFIQSIILQYGVPEKVLTDQGTNFLSQLMDVLHQQLGIERLRTTAYRPCCDGMIERFNRTLGDMIACYVNKQPDKWDRFLPYATFAYNTAVHSSTGYTPFYLMFGREAREPNDVLPPQRLLMVSDENTIFSQMWHDAKDIAKDKLKEAQERQKFYYDKQSKLKSYEIGDLVFLKEMQNAPGKFNLKWEGPYKIIEKKSDSNYKIQLPNEDKTYITHVDRLKLYRPNPTDGASDPKDIVKEPEKLRTTYQKTPSVERKLK